MEATEDNHASQICVNLSGVATPGNKSSIKYQDHNRQAPKENPRMLTIHKSKMELLEENARLHDELQSYEGHLRDMQTKFDVTQDKFLKTCDEKEHEREAFEKMVLILDIDPVTKKQIDCSPEDIKSFKLKHDNTQIAVSSLRESLSDFNRQAEQRLNELYNVKNEIDEMICSDVKEEMPTLKMRNVIDMNIINNGT